MKYKLVKEIKESCDNIKKWDMKLTASEWNWEINNNYAPATFTAAVNAGLLMREKYGKSYVYYLPPTKEAIEAAAAAKREAEIKHAKWYVEHYEETVAEDKANYEKEIKRAEEHYQRNADFHKELFDKYSALIAENT